MTTFDPCMVCESTDFEPLKVSNWKITGVGDLDVSFGLCRDCGHISQNPCPSDDVIEAFYRELSNYFHPEPDWSPPPVPAAETTKRLVGAARRFKPGKGSLYGIGIGSGRDLIYMQRQGWDVSGCEPSPTAAKQAGDLMSVDIEVGFADECLTGGRTFDVIMLSHVLEHVAKPKDMISLVHDHLDDDGVFLLEVPCARQAHRLCLGWLTLEHLSYFSTDILVRLLEEAGFFPMEITLDDWSHKYPTVTVVARKALDRVRREAPYLNQYAANKDLMEAHLRIDRAHWHAAEARFQHLKTAYVYAAGVHTAQLFSETNLLNKIEVVGIADSSPLKVGKQQGGRDIISKDQFLAGYAGQHVIISSYNSETQIAEMLAAEGIPAEKIVRLYT